MGAYATYIYVRAILQREPERLRCDRRVYEVRASGQKFQVAITWMSIVHLGRRPIADETHFDTDRRKRQRGEPPFPAIWVFMVPDYVNNV